jgi:hypothetical protein
MKRIMESARRHAGARVIDGGTVLREGNTGVAAVS